MKFDNKASPEIASKYMSIINSMFDSTGQGENLWNSLTDKHRRFFCKQAGFSSSFAETPLARMRPDTRKQLLQTIHEINRVSSIFKDISFCDFG